MSPDSVGSKLLEVARKIKQHEILDITIDVILGEIPVPILRGFLSRYWASLDEDDSTKAVQVAEFLEKLAAQEETLAGLEGHLEQQGELLIRMQKPLDVILSDVVHIRDDVTGLRDDVGILKRDVARITETFEIKSARDLLSTAATLSADAKRRVGVLQDIQGILEAEGVNLDTDTYYTVGMIFAAANHYDRAEAALLEAIKGDEAVDEAYYGLSLVYQRMATEHIRAENYGLAQAALDRAAEYAKVIPAVDPASIVAIQVQLGYVNKDLMVRNLGTGRQQAAQKAFQQAKTHLDTALKLDPNDANATNGLASIYLTMRDYDRAITYGERAVELSPNHLFAHHDLALSYLAKARSLNDPREQFELLQKGAGAYARTLELDGAGIDRLPERARQQLEAHYEPTLAWLEQMARQAGALGAAPGQGNGPGVHAYLQEGHARLGARDYEAARAAYERALAADPESAPAHLYYGAALLHLERGEEGLAAINRALELDPKMVSAHSARGAVLVGLGRYDEGLQAIERALELAPGYPEALYNGACAYSLTGQGEKAISWLQQAIEGYPGYRAQAAADPHFEPLREDPQLAPQFEALVRGP